jgi:hypothetical protein
MARIRTIKPEFPHSESMATVSRDARLTFILLWTIADDHGRLRGNPQLLASLLFPYDEDASAKIELWLMELDREGCIARYAIDGRMFVQISKWSSYQKIDHPTASRIPEFREGSRIDREALAPLRETPRNILGGLEGKGREGIGKEGIGAMVPLPRDGAVDKFKPIDLFRAAYPPRAGSQRWRDAEKSARARLAEGHTWEEMISGAERYGRFIRATGKIKTEFVQMASTFLGKNRSFLEPWIPPNGEADTRMESNQDAASEFMRRTEHAT